MTSAPEGRDKKTNSSPANHGALCAPYGGGASPYAFAKPAYDLESTDGRNETRQDVTTCSTSEGYKKPTLPKHPACSDSGIITIKLTKRPSGFAKAAYA